VKLRILGRDPKFGGEWKITDVDVVAIPVNALDAFLIYAICDHPPRNPARPHLRTIHAERSQ